MGDLTVLQIDVHAVDFENGREAAKRCRSFSSFIDPDDGLPDRCEGKEFGQPSLWLLEEIDIDKNIESDARHSA